MPAHGDRPATAIKRPAVKQRQRTPAARTLRDRELLAAIRRVYDASGGLYGARKVWWQLAAEGGSAHS